MKKILCLLVFLFFSNACSTNIKYVNEYNTPNNIDHLYQSVGMVQVQSKGNTLASATAFAYDKDHLLTAAHVCLAILEIQIFVTKEKSVNITYLDQNGKSKLINDVSVKTISDTDDICMLVKKDHGLRPVVFVDSLAEVKVRDEVVIIGAPLGVAIGEFHGHVMDLYSQLKHPMAFGRLIVSSASTGGVSGSPVFNAYGEVVGILVAGPSGFDHIGICVGVDAVHKFLKDNKYK